MPVCGGELAAVNLAISGSVRLKLNMSKSSSKNALFEAFGITGMPCWTTHRSATCRARNENNALYDRKVDLGPLSNWHATAVVQTDLWTGFVVCLANGCDELSR